MNRQGEGRDQTEAWDTRGEIVHSSERGSWTAVGVNSPLQERKWADTIFHPPMHGWTSVSDTTHAVEA